MYQTNIISTSRKMMLGFSILWVYCTNLYSAESQSNLNASYIKQAQPVFEQLAKSYPSLNIAVAKKGQVIWTASSGFSNIADKTPATIDTIYPLYSVAKGMTGILAAKMEQQGKLDIQKSVRFYLPDLPSHYQPVTVRHLLGHMAGIRHYKESGEDYATDSEWMQIAAKHCSKPEQTLELFVNDKLIATPGEHFEYSTFGYVLLSAVLEKVGGKSYSSLMTEHVFEKSNANGLRLDGPSTDAVKRAALYQLKSGEYVTTAMIDNSCRFGGGGFVGRALDLALVGSAYASGLLLDDKAMRVVETPLIPSKEDSFTGYGYAVGTAEINGKIERFLSHGGAALGARSYTYIIVNSGLAVAIVGNLEGEHQYKQARIIAKIFAGMEYKK